MEDSPGEVQAVVSVGLSEDVVEVQLDVFVNVLLVSVDQIDSNGDLLGLLLALALLSPIPPALFLSLGRLILNGQGDISSLQGERGSGFGISSRLLRL